jgi:4-alpha-glucanotransferase
MDLFDQAKLLGILTEFIDGQGHRHVTDEAALRIIVDAFPARTPYRFVEGPVVIRSGQPARTELVEAVALPLRWTIDAGVGVIAEGVAAECTILWPQNLPDGTYRLRLKDAAGETDDVPLMVTPARAFPGDFDRGWLLAAQLYGIRSARNWGMGDFTDLEGLIRLAGMLGADGVGLNPLHALFDDRPADCSPYSPNSRLFLNALYIDVEKIPEYQPVADHDEIARLRQTEIVDYAAVAALKWRSLRAAFEKFSTDPAAGRRADFEEFRKENAALLQRFSCF